MLRLIAFFALFCSTFATPYRYPQQPRNLEDFLTIIGLPNLPLPDPVRPRNTTVPVRYAYTEWSNYTECDKVCGGGMMERTRRCLANGGQEVPTYRCGPSSNGRRSPIDLIRRYWKGTGYKVEIQQKPCNTGACVTSEWRDWGECDRVCGGGSQHTTRTCVESKDQTKCNFQRSKMRRCNIQPCFQLTNWGEWGSCSRDCGGGLTQRSRKCEPALNSTNPEYQKLNYVLGIMKPQGSAPISLYNYATSLNDQNILFHYLSQYMRVCTDNMYDSGDCNNHACPSCPFNQIHYSCKPCPHHCNRVQVAFPYYSPRNFHPFASQYQLTNYLYGHVTGCNGICESGCGCPLLRPLLGSDGNCYSMPLLCPPSHIGAAVGNSGVPGYGRNFYSTFVPPTSTTTKPPPIETTTMDLIDEEQEAAEERELPLEGATPAGSEEEPDMREDCRFGSVIVTSPGQELPCRCQGTLDTVDCYTSGAACPVKCNKIPAPRVCPSFESPPPLSANGPSPPPCDDSCSSDTECMVGDKCCATACGRKCVNSVPSPEE